MVLQDQSPTENYLIIKQNFSKPKAFLKGRFIELYACEKGPPVAARLDGEDMSSILRLLGLLYLFLFF